MFIFALEFAERIRRYCSNSQPNWNLDREIEEQTTYIETALIAHVSPLYVVGKFQAWLRNGWSLR